MRRLSQLDGSGWREVGDSQRPLNAPRHRQQSRKVLQCRLSCFLLFGLALAIASAFGLGTFLLCRRSAAGGWPGRGGGLEWRPARGALHLPLRFASSDLLRRLEERGGLDRIRSQRSLQGVRPPRLALVLGGMSECPESLMLFSLMKSLRELGYMISVFSLEDGEVRTTWEQFFCQVTIISPQSPIFIDWSNYEIVILCSLEAKYVITSLMQEPFNSVPVIWIVHEDTLGKRLPLYAEKDWQNLILEWRITFRRANVLVFSDFSLPMLYTSLDSGNFYVIPGSPSDVWAAKSYIASHSPVESRNAHGFKEDDLIILVTGDYFFYEELPWDYAAAVNALPRHIKKFTNAEEDGGALKVALLYGNSTDTSGSVVGELASRMGFAKDSVRSFHMDGDVNAILLMADIVLYGCFHDGQSFPSLLLRAMSFGIPIVAPGSAIIKRYVKDRENGFIFDPKDPNSLAITFSLLIANKKLTRLARTVGSRGMTTSANMLAADCFLSYGKLLENIIQFPSDTVLPGSFSKIQANSWAWDMLKNDIGRTYNDVSYNTRANVVDILEEKLAFLNGSSNIGVNATSTPDFPTQQDWDDIREMEISEDYERREWQELEERVEKISGSWEEVNRNAKKAEKQKPKAFERDEGELERTGQQLCIYEVYNGKGTWPFLHHGSFYRGISFSPGARRPKTDDVDAISRLPVLNDTYTRDLLCDIGAMFSVANGIDNIHKTPWIGFQSWHAGGKKVSLSRDAEKALEDYTRAQYSSDTIYYWVPMGMDIHEEKSERNLDFWSLCDIHNNGCCRTTFSDAFRSMYGLPNGSAALPPMPLDSGNWSALHSWLMPTSSFVEFIMFSRMFADALDGLFRGTNMTSSCLLGSSDTERRHCYCRILEVLVNVWAYHSARKMVYLDPNTGEFHEQHLLEHRRGNMWVKYFDTELLKSMSEDLAEEADDGRAETTRSGQKLWPLTGEVLWQGKLDREREDRYRMKMDKKRKNKEKLRSRQKHGYKQKALGG